MTDVSIVIAFVAGVVSFLSPCVLPLIPGFLAYLAGVTVEQKEGESTSRLPIFLNSVFFVLGFSTVFAVLGVLLNTLLASVSYEVQTWLARAGGLIIIFFGLYLMGFIKVPFLESEHKWRVTKKFNSRYFTSYIFGAAFATGWTPCVGAALGAILGLAASTPGVALSLLFAYSLGLGIPFLVVGLFAAQWGGFLTRYTRAIQCFTVFFGAVLVILGVLVFTQSLNLIANLGWLNNFLLQ